MTNSGKNVSLGGDWFSDSDDISYEQDSTPKRKCKFTYSDSGGSTPDSPASTTWDYTLPAVDQKVKEAANKITLGMKKWRKRRKFLINRSPTLYQFRNAFYRKNLLTLATVDHQENLDPQFDDSSAIKANQPIAVALSELQMCSKEFTSEDRQSLESAPDKRNQNETLKGSDKSVNEETAFWKENDEDDDLFLQINI